MELEYWWIVFIIDGVLFFVVSLNVIYMSIFAFASLFTRHSSEPVAKHQNRFIILIPSYKSDSSIIQTVKSVLGQTYPQRLFDVTVVSDHQKEITNFRLAQFPITLLTPNFDTSTKGKSLQLAINNLPQFKIYDIVIVLDAGNIVEPDFLSKMNNAYEAAGTLAIQAHRMSKNRDTPIAYLDATFEEINNSIFRRGHIILGLSSAITGSGIAYDFRWFKENIFKSQNGWEDKELESFLMRQNIFVDYFDHIHVYDEKTRKTDDFNRQRGRWASTQLHAFMANIKYLPVAIYNKQYGFIDKIIQWILPPRTILMAIITSMCIILPFVYMTLAIKWWALFAWLLFIFAIATPDYLIDKKWEKAFIKVPFIMLSSILNLPRLIRCKKKFVHHNNKR
jgi:cellulose synthase/poly-beta-1,6-N-acetylglucosamine synthase-like glycosyltransferase